MKYMKHVLMFDKQNNGYQQYFTADLHSRSNTLFIYSIVCSIVIYLLVFHLLIAVVFQ